MISYNAKLQGIKQVKSMCSPEELVELYEKAADSYLEEFEKFKNKFQTDEEFQEFKRELETFNQRRA